MDKLILGLLILKSRTIYEIRSKFEQRLDLMYSSSMGSIQAALRKLLTLGYVRCRSYEEGRRQKKEYMITESGREAFYQWVNAPFETVQMKNPELARFYFMGLSDRGTRSERIRGHLFRLKELHASLKLLYEEGEKLTPTKEYADLFQYQFLTVKYGMDLTAFEIEWFTKLLENMEKTDSREG